LLQWPAFRIRAAPVDPLVGNPAPVSRILMSPGASAVG
jgi:hypothetical protein